ncbi:DUF4331 domain-containing protein [Polyangium aurulentum]|uniref:DUF4331 domain-containing protein n=1 Tax=Polyangium aurulentum TaxID=2567896 RepID=UPI0010ADA714|nr:DUF4331 domain-containing protein [Polyangium aurulentum]UQA62341.1 DUF4331 domain-containing protein [Polyangium aurulentum]
MMKRISWMSAALTALGVMATSGGAWASSHAEAPAIAEDPAADNTDLYAWVEGSNLVILANYNPLEEPASGPNFHKFSDEVLYEIHVARGPASLEDALTYQVRFKSTPFPNVDPANLSAPVGGGKEFFSQLGGSSQFYTVTKVEKGKSTVLAKDVPVAPANIGPRTNSIAYKIPDGTTYEQFFVDSAATSVIRPLGSGGAEGRVFAGPRDDGFSVDLGAVFDLAGLETVLGGTPFDNVAGYNVHTIALEIPLTVANGGKAVTPGASDAQTIGVWASASRRKTRILRKKDEADNFGPWIQVSRLGLPLINEAVIGLQDKDKYNRTHPKNDVENFGAYFLNPVIVRDAEFAGFYAAGGPLAGCPGGAAELKKNRTDVIDIISLNGALGHKITAIGDVLRVDLGTASQFPNGRKVMKNTNKEEDVTDTELSLLLCKLAAPVPDGVDTNDATFKANFPYLAPPWEGSRQGKGEK